ncbi:MAG: homocysteine S-methyltransferase family protein, partial [Bacillota bacterium]
AMGTELIKQGYPLSRCLETANREQPELVGQIHARYVAAGANIISTNTFGANRFRLREHGIADQVVDLVHRGTALAKRAAGGRALVALSVGPSGVPVGADQETAFQDLVEGFREQIKAGSQAGADLISLETMTDIQELRAAVVAAREVCDLPIMAQLTFDGHLHTLSGTPAATAAAILSGLDLDLIGANCSEGPEQLVEALKLMADVSSLPLIVQPNAGVPILNGAGQPAYPVTPEMMADAVPAFIRLGARVIGSCCGSDPTYTRAIAAVSRSVNPLPPIPCSCDGLLASQTHHLTIGHQAPPILISERFSAFYRSDIHQALIHGERLPLMDEAVEQRSAGARAINISVSAPGLVERPAMEMAIAIVQQTAALPLSIQSNDPMTMELALQVARGRPLLNAVRATEQDMGSMLPMARRYGAMAIVIPQDEDEHDHGLRKLLSNAQKVVESAMRLGLRRQDLIVDCLAGFAAASPQALDETLRLSELVHEELGLCTLFGVSGASTGRRQRALLNAAYAAMAIHAGADALIGNPLQRELVSSVLAAGELMGRRRGSP